jgi:hypothetical protein
MFCPEQHILPEGYLEMGKYCHEYQQALPFQTDQLGVWFPLIVVKGNFHLRTDYIIVPDIRKHRRLAEPNHGICSSRRMKEITLSWGIKPMMRERSTEGMTINYYRIKEHTTNDSDILGDNCHH